MTSNLPFIDQSFTIYKYEAFSYTWSNGGNALSVSVPTNIPVAFVSNNITNVVFSSSNYTGATSASEILTITDTVTNAVSRNTVTIGAGRFVDSTGAGMTGQVFNLYKNEPFTPISFVGPFSLSNPVISSPALPPGIIFAQSSSNAYDISGNIYPSIQVPSRKYQVIGRDVTNISRIVTSEVFIAVNAERIRLNTVGGTIISNMTTDIPISSVTTTAAYPYYPWSGANLRYTWNALPDGIVFTDSSGNPQTSGFLPSESNSTIILSGTPTVAAAKSFASAGISNYSVSLNALRLAPSPNITNNVPFTFAFSETVLFDDVTIPTQYVSNTIATSNVLFRARTYFGSNAPITSLFSPDLRSDLSINFNYALQVADLCGTPSNTPSVNFTLRAINSNGVTRDLNATVPISNDSVSFDYGVTIPVDTSFNFIISRPLDFPKTGYYTSPINFKATAASGRAVTYSDAGFNNNGITLSDASNNIVTLTGLPNVSNTTLTTATITAATSGTGSVSASTTIKYKVLNDTFTFTPIPSSNLQFVQNRSITPFQVSATTLSGRNVSSYSATGLPNDLTISSTGIVSGLLDVSTDGSFIVIATTGYASGTSNISYTVIADSILFVTPQPSYTLIPGEPVSIPIVGVTYSGATVSNFAFSGFVPSLGLSIGSVTGTISGNLSTGIPPEDLLPISSNFSVTAQAGFLDSSTNVTLVTTNPLVYRSYLGNNENSQGILFASDTSSYTLWNTLDTPNFSYITDFKVKNDTVDSNTYLFACSNDIIRSTTGVDFYRNEIGILTLDNNSKQRYSIYQLLKDLCDSFTWYGIGSITNSLTSNVTPIVLKSIDDGISWDLSGANPIVNDKGSNAILPRNQVSYGSNYYSLNGLAFSYKDDIFMAGGGKNTGSFQEADRVLVRQFIGEPYWLNAQFLSNDIEFSYIGEVSKIEVAHPTTWVLSGSGLYETYRSSFTWDIDAPTIFYSTDTGITWNAALGDTPNYIAYDVVYGSNSWLAYGLKRTFVDDVGDYCYFPELKFSLDGSNWSNVNTFSNSMFSNDIVPSFPIGIGPMHYDGSNWNVIIQRKALISGDTPIREVYTHNNISDLSGNWSLITEPIMGGFSSSSILPLVGFPKSRYVRIGTPTTLNMSFPLSTTGGPVITSPIATSYLFYQYLAIQPIVLASTDFPVYFFVTSADLPAGLTYNPVTFTISGTPTQVGRDTVTIYAKNAANKVTILILDITTIIPRIIHPQSNASSYTSLLRQYTVVNAAQNAVNNRTLPSTETSLGEFMAPPPPDLVKDKICGC